MIRLPDTFLAPQVQKALDGYQDEIDAQDTYPEKAEAAFFSLI